MAGDPGLDAAAAEGGFPMPELVVENVTGRVVRHDGRHRCAMVALSGGDRVPVAIRYRDQGTWTLSWFEIGHAPGSIRTGEATFRDREGADALKSRLENGGGRDGAACRMIVLAHREGNATDGTDLPAKLSGQFDASLTVPTSGMARAVPKIGRCPGEDAGRVQVNP